MKILAIESSAITASVALVEDDTVIAEYTINYKKTHSQTLLPMIAEICSMTNTDVKDVDVIAVSAGPGSFTGLRIGAATGKGIALVTGQKMAQVPTLEAMAYNLYGDTRLICPVMDARRQHLYSGIYEFKDGKLVTVHEQCLISYEELADMLNALGREVVFVGDGIDVACKYFDENLKCQYNYAPLGQRSQRASLVAMVAKEMAQRGELIDAAQLKPDYLRPSQAEREHNAAR
ncbi:MAG: tRNA (adenosine(37)-N6)-threonylcarbamoyltransferase complex dimerization subunit type 1 TsaB [Lachnospira sp.]|nr:tRNA (adenosine(37)-N6)-threonylcarbamoyltransferase complex dimerization subunit type 1 TsaB [Lachnospira sp.]